MGISSGEAAFENGDWFGTPVVEAARLEGAARPGQILVSEVVRSIVGNDGGAKFRSAGKREFKGFARPVPVVEVVWRDESTPPPVKRGTPAARAGRLARGAGLDEREAKKAIQESDRQRRDYLRRFYAVRQELPLYYDLVVNTDAVAPARAAQVVLAAAEAL